MAADLPSVTDMKGTQYPLDRLLGRGVHGMVYSVKDRPLAVKLLYAKGEEQREQLRNQLAQVRRLDLDGIAVARPLEMVRAPFVGYVMQLLTEMQPISTIAYQSKDESSLSKWYLQTGGLRRRLRILGRTADALNWLHARALAHADVSPNNVLISEAVDRDEMCLIDADNIRYQSSAGHSALFTRGYGAPELMDGRSGTNTLTDTHAFSVLAFKTLCHVHPLIGDWVANGEPELEEEALLGRLPWIDHPTDKRNHSSVGIPRRIVLSPKLQELAARAFGDGLSDPTLRPGVADWAEYLHRAADFTLPCPTCGSAFYASEPGCPWCETLRPPFVAVQVGLWDPQRKTGEEWKNSSVSGMLALTQLGSVMITRRLGIGCVDKSAHTAMVEIRMTPKRRLHLRSLDDHQYILQSWNADHRYEITDRWLHFDTQGRQSEFVLHLGAMDRPHKYASFSFVDK
jgi:eukaryotic-like serine/threonine-protein kinase